MKWLAPIASLWLACSPVPRPIAEREPAAPLREAEDPAPEYEDHSDVAPDQLDAGTSLAAECEALPEPPAAAKAASRVLSGPPVTNHFPPEVIMRPMRARMTCIRACYHRALQREPSLEGRVVVQFVVDTDGYARRAKSKDSEAAMADVSRCVAAQIVGMRFPAPDGAVTVIYPFVFRRD